MSYLHRAELTAIEAIYRVERTSTARWLEQTLHAIRPLLDRGGGISAHRVVLGPNRVAEDGRIAIDPFPREAMAWEAYRAMPEAQRRRLYHSHAVFDERLARTEMFDQLVTRFPEVRGSTAIHAIDERGRGVVVRAWATGHRSTRVPTRARLERLSRHLSKGFRLVEQLAHVVPLDAAEAVLDVAGNVIHASGRAREAVLRAALRARVRVLDRARGSASQDPMSAWLATIEGRWTMLDTFDTDGRRFVIVLPSTPPGGVTLSAREREASQGAARGHSDKRIASELGVTVSTVAALLRRARVKLGARTRVELIRRMRERDDA